MTPRGASIGSGAPIEAADEDLCWRHPLSCAVWCWESSSKRRARSRQVLPPPMWAIRVRWRSRMAPAWSSTRERGSTFGSTRHERYRRVTGRPERSSASRKDSARPFVVNSGGTRACAQWGTQFDVYRAKTRPTIVTVVWQGRACDPARRGRARRRKWRRVLPSAWIEAGRRTAGDSLSHRWRAGRCRRRIAGAARPCPDGCERRDVLGAQEDRLRRDAARRGREGAQSIRRRSIRVDDEDLGSARHQRHLHVDGPDVAVALPSCAQPGVRIIETDQEIRITREPSR